MRITTLMQKQCSWLTPQTNCERTRCSWNERHKRPKRMNDVFTLTFGINDTPPEHIMIYSLQDSVTQLDLCWTLEQWKRPRGWTETNLQTRPCRCSFHLSKPDTWAPELSARIIQLYQAQGKCAFVVADLYIWACKAAFMSRCRSRCCSQSFSVVDRSPRHSNQKSTAM